MVRAKARTQNDGAGTSPFCAGQGSPDPYELPLAGAVSIVDERADGQPVNHWRSHVPSQLSCLMAECSISVSSWHVSEIVIEVTCGSMIRP